MRAHTHTCTYTKYYSITLYMYIVFSDCSPILSPLLPHTPSPNQLLYCSQSHEGHCSPRFSWIVSYKIVPCLSSLSTALMCFKILGSSPVHQQVTYQSTSSWPATLHLNISFRRAGTLVVLLLLPWGISIKGWHRIFSKNACLEKLSFAPFLSK